MKISRRAYAAAALGTTLLLGACFAGHPAVPASPPPPALETPAKAKAGPSTSPSTPPTGTVRHNANAARRPVPAPAVPAQRLVPAAPAPIVRAPAHNAPAPAVRPVPPAPRRGLPLAVPAPQPMVPPPARVPRGNDHDADNNGGPDDGDGNR